MGANTNENQEDKEVDTAFDMDAFNRAKEEKQSLVLELVTSHCTSNSSFEDLQRIAAALQKGDQLRIENLSGGYTNYTYKLYLASDQDTALFAKLAFTHAFWNPDPDFYYDLQRTANEFTMMERFEAVAPGCVATPYLLLDTEDGKSKLIVTQWSTADEQLANQFIDGLVDPRVSKNLATSLAAIACMKIDPDFNSDCRDCMINIFPDMKQVILKKIESPSDDDDRNNSRATKLAKELGVDYCNTIFDACTNNYRSREITCHSDLHAFNILVERKPDVQHLENFGPNGTVVICDWEMAMCGPIGLDVGRIYSIPVASILAHAVSGNEDAVQGLREFLSEFWIIYSSAMKSAGKDEDFLCKSYRNAMAFLGWKLLGIYTFGWFVPFLPVSENDVEAFKDSLCVVSLKLMRWGFAGYEEGLSVAELQSRLHRTIDDELSIIQSQKRRTRGRRSSVLRETNRRVSDAFIGMGSMSSSAIAAIFESEFDDQVVEKNI